MRITAIHEGFIMPIKSTIGAGAIDLFMPIAGIANAIPQLVGLGFKAAVPPGFVALLLPRSSTGAKFGLELNNTVGLIDSDYRGEWKACLRTKDGRSMEWAAGDRLIQCVVLPIANIELELVDSLDETDRGEGGFGSTGQ